MNRAIRYRLRPQTQEKARRLYQASGACRYVWNHFVSKPRDEHEYYGQANYRYFTTGKQFVSLRRRQVKRLQNYSADFECQSCGRRAYADADAALNIAAAGNDAAGRGSGEAARSMKRHKNTAVSVGDSSI